MAILAQVLNVIDLLIKVEPVVTSVITNMKPFAEALYQQFSGEELTEEQRAELYAAVDAQYAHFMRPQSPAQPGDPDFVKSGGEA